MDRRALLQQLAATTGLAVLDALSPAGILALGRRTHAVAPAEAVLTARQAETVTTAAERIIPATDTPGATDAGVTAFVEHMLADWLTPAERDGILAGLAELDARCRALRGREFVDCDEADQVVVLTALDDEVTALRGEPGAAANEHWFSRFKYLTAWGYCTSEVAQHRTLGVYPLPMRYDACAPLEPRRGAGRPEDADAAT